MITNTARRMAQTTYGCTIPQVTQLTYEFQNVMMPHLGKAGMPYAKSVRTTKGLHGAKPDPGLLFDCWLHFSHMCGYHTVVALTPVNSVACTTGWHFPGEQSRNQQHALLPCYCHYTR